MADTEVPRERVAPKDEGGRFGRGAVAVEHLDAVALPSTSGGGS